MTITETQLDLLNDLSIKKQIIPKIDTCITKHGSQKLKEYVNIIVGDVNILNKKKAILEYILKNNTEKNNIKKILRKFNNRHSIIDKWLYDDPCKDLHFEQEMFNKSMLLTFSNKMKFISVMIYPLIYLTIFGVMKYFGIQIDLTDYIKSLYYGYLNTIKFLLSLIISGSALIYLVSHALSVLYCLYQIYSLYNTFNNGILHYKKCSSIDSDFKEIGQSIKLLKNILNSNIFQNIKNNLDLHNYSQDLIIDVCDSFDNKSLGEMILLHYNKPYKKKLLDILDFIGHIDAQICISEMINFGYTLPQYELYEKPFVIATDIFHPSLCIKSQIKNSVIISDPNLIIITGPNKAGKSTFMKSLLLSIFLAQTLGVTCCKNLVFTPFVDIYTYLNVPDSIGRESLFEAEINRCFNFYNKIKSLKANEYVFCIIDELFTGTNPPEGISSSFAICKKLTECKNSIICVSTHFYDICTIPNVIYKKFIANKINHKYHFPYKICDGISDQYIAIDLLKEKGYDGDIIDCALDKLKQLN